MWWGCVCTHWAAISPGRALFIFACQSAKSASDSGGGMSAILGRGCKTQAICQRPHPEIKLRWDCLCTYLADLGDGEGLGGGEHVATGRGDLVDDTPFEGLRGRFVLAGRHERKRGFTADEARQTLGALASREQANVDLRQADGGLLVDDAVVAAERGLEAAAERVAVDRRHDRHVQPLEAEHVALLAAEVDDRRAATGAERADVGTGAEAAASAVDDDTLDAWVRLDRQDRGRAACAAAEVSVGATSGAEQRKQKLDSSPLFTLVDSELTGKWSSVTTAMPSASGGV